MSVNKNTFFQISFSSVFSKLNKKCNLKKFKLFSNCNYVKLNFFISIFNKLFINMNVNRGRYSYKIHPSTEISAYSHIIMCLKPFSKCFYSA